MDRGISIPRDGGMGTGMDGGMVEDKDRQKHRLRNRVITPRCSMEDGACPCRPHLMGRQCDQVQPGFFCAPLDYYTYEAEQATSHGHGHPQLPVSPRLVHGYHCAPCSMHGCHRALCVSVTLSCMWLSPCPVHGCPHAWAPVACPIPAGHHPGRGAPGLPGVRPGGARGTEGTPAAPAQPPSHPPAPQPLTS